MSEIRRIIEESFYLEGDFESDARYTWPKRWAAASNSMEELEQKLDIQQGFFNLAMDRAERAESSVVNLEKENLVLRGIISNLLGERP